MPNTRETAPASHGVVLFLVGMRVNRLWAIHKWLPVTIAMPRMLVELRRNRDLGLLGTPRTFVSGRLVMVQQYWRSYEQLEAYAKDPAHSHLPAWRAFNRAARDNTAVGIFHETYVIGPANHENIYVNVGRPLLLGAATGVITVGAAAESARERLEGG